VLVLELELADVALREDAQERPEVLEIDVHGRETEPPFKQRPAALSRKIRTARGRGEDSNESSMPRPRLIDSVCPSFRRAAALCVDHVSITCRVTCRVTYRVTCCVTRWAMCRARRAPHKFFVLRAM
jgi:hypothetical protein